MLKGTTNKKMIPLLMASLAMSINVYGQNESRAHVALTDSTTGKIWVQRNGQKINLSSQSPLYEGDIVFTDKSGHVQLVFTDGTVAALNESTRLGICSYSYEKDKVPGLKLCLNSGAIRIVSGKIAEYNLDGIVVESSQALVVPRGGSLVVMDYANTSTNLAVSEFYHAYPVGFLNLNTNAWHDIKLTDKAHGVEVNGKKQKVFSALISERDIANEAKRQSIQQTNLSVEQTALSCGHYLSQVKRSNPAIEQTGRSIDKNPGSNTESENPPIDGGPIENPPIDGGPIEIPPIDGGPIEIPPIDGGPEPVPPPIDPGPIEIPPIDGGPIEIPPIDGGPIEIPPIDGGPIEIPPIDGGPIEIPPIDGGPIEIPPIGGGPIELPPIGGGPLPIPPIGGGPLPISPIDPGPIEVLPGFSATYSGRLTAAWSPDYIKGNFSFNVQLNGSSGSISNAMMYMNQNHDEKIKVVNGSGAVSGGNFNINNFTIESAVNANNPSFGPGSLGKAEMSGTVDSSSTSGSWIIHNPDGTMRHDGNFNGKVSGTKK